MIKEMWRELKVSFWTYIKVAAVILGLIALFVIAASAASPIFSAFDTITGYGV